MVCCDGGGGGGLRDADEWALMRIELSFFSLGSIDMFVSEVMK